MDERRDGCAIGIVLQVGVCHKRSFLASQRLQGQKHLQGAKEAQAGGQVSNAGLQHKVEIAGGGPIDGVEGKRRRDPLAASTKGKFGEDPGSHGDAWGRAE